MAVRVFYTWITGDSDLASLRNVLVKVQGMNFLCVMGTDALSVPWRLTNKSPIGREPTLIASVGLACRVICGHSIAPVDDLDVEPDLTIIGRILSHRYAIQVARGYVSFGISMLDDHRVDCLNLKSLQPGTSTH